MLPLPLARKRPKGPPSVQDSTNTPSKSSAAAVVNAPNPPEGKELNNVITGLEAMHIHCSELDVEEFFKEFVPGKDPSGSDYEQFYDIASMHMKKCAPEWRARADSAPLAHRDAWNAGVLYRDISVGNIMIDETYDEKGVLKEEGVLCDWDLCKYKDQMNNGRRTADRTVRTQNSYAGSH